MRPEGTQLDESTTLDCIFPEGPHSKKDTKLDFIIADDESTFDLIVHFYLVDLVSVLEMLDDPVDSFNSSARKGPHVVERPIGASL